MILNNLKSLPADDRTRVYNLARINMQTVAILDVEPMFKETVVNNY